MSNLAVLPFTTLEKQQLETGNFFVEINSDSPWVAGIEGHHPWDVHASESTSGCRDRQEKRGVYTPVENERPCPPSLERGQFQKEGKDRLPNKLFFRGHVTRSFS